MKLWRGKWNAWRNIEDVVGKVSRVKLRGDLCVVWNCLDIILQVEKNIKQESDMIGFVLLNDYFVSGVEIVLEGVWG